MKFLLRLYPPAWRSRYGAEVTALLDERRLHLVDAPDLVLGALDAHRHLGELGLTPHEEGGSPMSLRQTGWTAILGGVLWLLAYLGVYFVGTLASREPRGIPSSEGSILLLTLLVAPVCIVVALATITRSLATRRRLWSWSGLLVSAIGAGVMTTGLLVNAVLPDRPLVNDVGPTEWWVIGMLAVLIGSFVFATVLLATAAVSRRAAAMLLLGAFVNTAILLTATAGLMTEIRSVAVALSGALFGIGWVALGVETVRRHQSNPAVTA